MSIGVVELGGSHVSAARVRPDAGALLDGSFVRLSLAAHGSRGELLETILDAAASVADEAIECWGVATPGPFDYERGVCTIRGVGKLEGLYGVDLRAALARRLRIDDPRRVVFLNDADAFLLGEWVAGRATGHRRAVGITLGTGLGSAFLVDGEISEHGAGVPPDGRLDLVPYRGRPVEEVISARGLVAAYPGGMVDAATIVQRARDGERAARRAFSALGAALGEFVDPWIERFGPSCLVLGGSMARSWDLMQSSFHSASPAAAALRECGAAQRLDDAPLLGAALHAVRRAGR